MIPCCTFHIMLTNVLRHAVLVLGLFMNVMNSVTSIIMMFDVGVCKPVTCVLFFICHFKLLRFFSSLMCHRIRWLTVLYVLR